MNDIRHSSYNHDMDYHGYPQNWLQNNYKNPHQTTYFSTCSKKNTLE